MANFVLSCQIVLIPYLIPRFSHNHQEIFTIVPYSTLIPEAIFHQEGYCRNCTVFHLVFPRLTHIFFYIFIVKYIHNILSLIPYLFQFLRPNYKISVKTGTEFNPVFKYTYLPLYLILS